MEIGGKSRRAVRAWGAVAVIAVVSSLFWAASLSPAKATLNCSEAHVIVAGTTTCRYEVSVAGGKAMGHLSTPDGIDPETIIYFGHDCCYALPSTNSSTEGFTAWAAKEYGAAVLAMDYRGDGGWDVMKGYEDLVAAARDLPKVYTKARRMIAWGVGMGAEVTGMAVAARPDLFHYWIATNPVSNLAEQYALLVARHDKYSLEMSWIEDEASGPPTANSLNPNDPYAARSPAMKAGEISRLEVRLPGGVIWSRMRHVYIAHGTGSQPVAYTQGRELFQAINNAGRLGTTLETVTDAWCSEKCSWSWGADSMDEPADVAWCSGVMASSCAIATQLAQGSEPDSGCVGRERMISALGQQNVDRRACNPPSGGGSPDGVGPEPTTEPSPSPSPSPTAEPTPDPSPSASPTTEPSPSPSPTAEPSPSPSPSPTAEAIQEGPTSNVLLRTLWQVARKSVVKLGTDLRTVTEPSGWDGEPTVDAQFYAYAPQVPGSVPLYEMHNTLRDDWMNSLISEPDYERTSAIAHVSSDCSAFGLSTITRIFSETLKDHGLRRPLEEKASYADKGQLGCGYARYGSATESIVSASGGGVTLDANLVAGGSIWRWTHNGEQYINVFDHGRQLQSALFWDWRCGSVDTSAIACRNPTEAGSKYSGPDLPSWAKQGSPVHTYQVINQDTASPTLSTRAVPLDWDPAMLKQNAFGGSGGVSNPIIWPDILLGKNVTLNYAGLGAVAKYSTHLQLPKAIPVGPTGKYGWVEVPTAYLRGKFNSFYQFDAVNNSRVQVPVNPCPQSDTQTAHYQDQMRFSPDFGGVIISDPTGLRAMGVYGANTAVGGSVSWFSTLDFRCGSALDGPHDWATTKWNAVYDGPLAEGENVFTTWVISGTLEEVTSQMRTLYSMGVK